MRVRLEQMPDGKWYKLGAGRPIEATDQEVALWQSAQEDAAQAAIKPPSIWDSAFNLVKEATVLILVLTFVTLFADWNRTSTLYAELGAPDLALARLANDPIHGFAARYVGLVVLLTCAIIGLGWLVYGELARWIAQSERLQGSAGLLPPLLVSAALVMLFLLFAYEVTTWIALLGFLLLLGALVVAWFATRDWIEEAQRKRFTQILILLVGVGSFFAIALWVIPERWGRLEAERILEGRDALQGAVLITTEKTTMSDQVDVIQGADETWIYQSQHMAVPGTDERTHTLQYIGADDDAVYLLDLGIEAVHVIPRGVVAELILLPATPRMRAFPDAGIYVETMDSLTITSTVPITIPTTP
jgi:hypothetical protein